MIQLLGHGRWFSPGAPASSTTKTGRHDIAKILLNVALKHQKSNQIKSSIYIFWLRLMHLQTCLDSNLPIAMLSMSYVTHQMEVYTKTCHNVTVVCVLKNRVNKTFFWKISTPCCHQTLDIVFIAHDSFLK